MQFLINSKLIYLVISMKGFNSVNPAHKTSWPTFPLKPTTTPTPHWHTHTHKVTHLSDYHHSRRFLSFNRIHPVGNSRYIFSLFTFWSLAISFVFSFFPMKSCSFFPLWSSFPAHHNWVVLPSKTWREACQGGRYITHVNSVEMRETRELCNFYLLIDEK